MTMSCFVLELIVFGFMGLHCPIDLTLLVIIYEDWFL